MAPPDCDHRLGLGRRRHRQRDRQILLELLPVGDRIGRVQRLAREGPRLRLADLRRTRNPLARASAITTHSCRIRPWYDGVCKETRDNEESQGRPGKRAAPSEEERGPGPVFCPLVLDALVTSSLSLLPLMTGVDSRPARCYQINRRVKNLTERSMHQALSRRERQIMDVLYGTGGQRPRRCWPPCPDPDRLDRAHAIADPRDEGTRRPRDAREPVRLCADRPRHSARSALRHLVETFFDGSRAKSSRRCSAPMSASSRPTNSNASKRWCAARGRKRHDGHD